MRRTQKGFSAIELICVIGIALILLLVAVSLFLQQASISELAVCQYNERTLLKQYHNALLTYPDATGEQLWQYLTDDLSDEQVSCPYSGKEYEYSFTPSDDGGELILTVTCPTHHETKSSADN